MRSWPSPYLPPSQLEEHPSLSLRDSYSGKNYLLDGERFSSYVCGITPYDATHLGHAATYLTYDLIHRFLIASGKEVNFIQNITDIDDPLLERAKRDGVDWEALAGSQIDLFRSDMTALRVIAPSAFCGVVESMAQIIGEISELISRDFTYQIENDIYLDYTKVPGAIDSLPISLSKAIDLFAERGGDPDRPGKRHPLDSLLWLGSRAGEPSWSAPFGPGRPGWHIECLAIARHNVESNGTVVTIQGGGIDLYFPHHYMTNIQSLALTGKPFASVFTHSGMIGLDGEKMSKSRGNLLFVSKLTESGIRPEVIRLALINRKYRHETMWEMARFDSAAALLSRLEGALAREDVAPTKPVVEALVSRLADDLDTEGAISELESWCKATESGKTGGSAGELSRAIDLYLGLAL
jgi:L-cysteine:1D-myo-inositol 2-amino-2-deoxy-alpha-D-glucopyranoside ligase